MFFLNTSQQLATLNIIFSQNSLEKSRECLLESTTVDFGSYRLLFCIYATSVLAVADSYFQLDGNLRVVR